MGDRARRTTVVKDHSIVDICSTFIYIAAYFYSVRTSSQRRCTTTQYFYSKEISIAMITYRISIFGVRRSHNDIPVICSLLYREGLIIICSTIGFTPHNGSTVICFHQPIIITAMITTHVSIIGVRTSGYDITVICSLLYREG